MALPDLQVRVTADNRQLKTGLDDSVKRVQQFDRQGRTALRGTRAAFGQLGFQVQDIAVQLQSGTNAMMVLGQQGSQIASIFGPGGAVVGAFLAVGAAIGTALLPALFDSRNALADMVEEVEGLDDILTRSARGTYAFSDAFVELAKSGDAVAQLKLGAAIAGAQTAVESIGDAVKQTVDEAVADNQTLLEKLNDFGRKLDFSKAIDAMGEFENASGKAAGQFAEWDKLGPAASEGGLSFVVAVKSIAEAFDVANPQAAQFLGLMADMKRAETAEEMQGVAQGLADLVKQAPKLGPLVNSMTGVVTTSIDAANAMATLNSNTAEQLGLLELEIGLMGELNQELKDREAFEKRLHERNMRNYEAELAAQEKAAEVARNIRIKARGYNFEQTSEAKKIAEAFEDAWDSVEATTEDALTDALMGMRSWGDAAKAILLDVAREFMRVNVAKPLVSGISAGISSFVAEVKHTGGTVGGGGMQRMVSAANFVNAPRYHNGGIAGLKPNEVPAILEKGEQVIPKNGAAGGAVTVNFNIQAVDGRSVQEMLMSQRGTITGIISQAFNDRGRMSPLG